ncbi:hypothetical protein TNCV_1393361 [Trichonephila clavipes]|nr:hypothetical protein TNCV_1393361 [Trichonephila clavipes]
MLPVLGKKAVLEWCMEERLIGSSYVCLKCGKSMELRERTDIKSQQQLPQNNSEEVDAIEGTDMEKEIWDLLKTDIFRQK